MLRASAGCVYSFGPHCLSPSVGLASRKMRTARIKWSVGSTAFFLPGLTGIVGDAISRSAANGSHIATLFGDMFLGSIFVAACVTASMIMVMPMPLSRRFAFAAAVWIILCLQVYVIFAWSLREIH